MPARNPSRTNVSDKLLSRHILYNGGIAEINVGWTGFNKWKATWLNAGVPKKKIPPRPFLFQGQKDINRPFSLWLRSQFGNSHNRRFTRRETAMIKRWVKQWFQRLINNWKTPPNKPSTIRRKGRNDPLVDTGSMRDRVQVWVIMRRPSQAKTR